MHASSRLPQCHYHPLPVGCTYRHSYRQRQPLKGVVAGRSAYLEANNDTYAAVVDDKLAVRLGRGSWEPAQAGEELGKRAWQLAVSGPGFAVWEARF